MTRAVFYDDSHRRIAEGGIEGIAAVLQGDDEAEKASLLLCLDYYLDPYYGCTLAHESEIFALLQQLLLSGARKPSETTLCSFWAITAAILACCEAGFLRRLTSFCRVSSA